MKSKRDTLERIWGADVVAALNALVNTRAGERYLRARRRMRKAPIMQPSWTAARHAANDARDDLRGETREAKSAFFAAVNAADCAPHGGSK